ncbi:MAG: RDD family protein [Candidatus Bathyarchaeota archaeon]|nr:RDD family protein [Candidatus Bathyarchaeota archaeon]
MTADSSLGIDFNHWIYRFLALLIDSVIIGIPVYIIWNFVFWSIFWSGDWWLIGYGSWLILPFIFGIIQLFYFVILDVAWGATIGKRIFGLKVQMTNGSKVQFGQAFLRNLSKVYWLFLLLDWIIGIATPGPDKRQKYTDRMAGTTVIQIKQAFAAVSPPPPPPPS